MSSIRNIINELSNISLIKEPGQDIKTFGSQVIEKTRRVVRSGSATSDITYIVFQCFIGCDVLALKLKALQFYDIVDDDPTGMEWDAIARKHNPSIEVSSTRPCVVPSTLTTMKIQMILLAFTPRLTS